MKSKSRKLVQGILKTGVIIPITDPAEQAEVDRRFRDAENPMVKSPRKMRSHEFTLVLTASPTKTKAEKFYGICNDATVSVRSGVGQIRFHRDGKSLEEALRSAMRDVKAAGLKVERVEMAPDAVLLET